MKHRLPLRSLRFHWLVTVAAIYSASGIVSLRAESTNETVSVVAPAPAAASAISGIQDLLARGKAFQKSADEGQAAELSLSIDDLNLLTAHHESLISKKHQITFLRISDNQLFAEIVLSIPPTEAGTDAMKQLNGLMGIEVSWESGVPKVRLRTLEIEGKSFDDNVLDVFSAQIAQAVQAIFQDEIPRNPSASKIAGQIKSLRISENSLIVSTANR